MRPLPTGKEDSKLEQAGEGEGRKMRRLVLLYLLKTCYLFLTNTGPSMRPTEGVSLGDGSFVTRGLVML